jgi:tellurite resistance protein TerC
MLKRAWRVIVLAAGLIVLLVGIALLVLPGPAFVVIPIGLAILATEFAWARRWLARIRSASRAAVDRVTRTK